ncbi:hypothetical protein ACWD7Y_14240 [Streptomyces drozdowiczii]
MYIQKTVDNSLAAPTLVRGLTSDPNHGPGWTYIQVKHPWSHCSELSPVFRWAVFATIYDACDDLLRHLEQGRGYDSAADLSAAGTALASFTAIQPFILVAPPYAWMVYEIGPMEVDPRLKGEELFTRWWGGGGSDSDPFAAPTPDWHTHTPQILPIDIERGGCW